MGTQRDELYRQQFNEATCLLEILGPDNPTRSRATVPFQTHLIGKLGKVVP